MSTARALPFEVALLVTTAIAAAAGACSSTLPADHAITYGGLRVELVAGDTAVVVRRSCIVSRFEPLPAVLTQESTITGVITAATSASAVGTPQRMLVRASGDSLFIASANLIRGEWTPYYRTDTLLRGVPGTFTGGGSCVQ